MRHRQDSHKRFAVRLTFNGERDDAGTVLATFLQAALRFVVP
jgi:hypothetical protein